MRGRFVPARAANDVSPLTLCHPPQPRSPLGVGTDIGGSVRIPSAFCGLYGLRPTARRFPYGKALNSLMGQEAVESVLGPMTPDLSGCVAFTKGVLETEPWNEDPSTIPLPWREE